MLRYSFLVLNAIAAASADFSEHANVQCGDRSVKVHFDNYTHSSGKQRAYVRCCARGDTAHPRCFYYGVVEQWPNKRIAAAWLAAWASTETEMTKSEHMKFTPSQAAVDALVPHATDLE